jgi:hypothetical protein
MGFKRVPKAVQILICMAYIVGVLGVYLSLEINEFLGLVSYLCLIISMRCDNINALRLWGAAAGTIFVVQFIIADMPLINILAQTGLVIYGIYKAVQGTKEEKNFTKVDFSDKVVQGKGII